MCEMIELNNEQSAALFFTFNNNNTFYLNTVGFKANKA